MSTKELHISEKGYAAMLWSVANVFPIVFPTINFTIAMIYVGFSTLLNLFGIWRFRKYAFWFALTIVLNAIVIYFMGHLTIMTALPRIPYYVNAYWDMYWQFKAQASGLRP